jgi:polyhydroxyalkanoic acid synthase PhaR subunit
MSSQPTSSDPFASWREWLSQSERQWNAFFNEVMATDQFGQSMGRMMDVYLNMQKSMNEVMGRYFVALNIPSRTDVLSLGTRLGEIEQRLEAIESAIKRVPAGDGAPATAATGLADVPRPPRTKKPPSES